MPEPEPNDSTFLRNLLRVDFQKLQQFLSHLTRWRLSEENKRLPGLVADMIPYSLVLPPDVADRIHEILLHANL